MQDASGELCARNCRYGKMTERGSSSFASPRLLTGTHPDAATLSKLPAQIPHVLVRQDWNSHWWMEPGLGFLLVVLLYIFLIAVSEILFGDAKPIYGWRFWLWEFSEDRLVRQL